MVRAAVNNILVHQSEGHSEADHSQAHNKAEVVAEEREKIGPLQAQRLKPMHNPQSLRLQFSETS
jgi:hypothetical protein